jgi:hypothetical protein
MTVQTFRDLLTASPFQPFRVVMSSGEHYEVRHPEMAMLTRSDILIGMKTKAMGFPPVSGFVLCCTSLQSSQCPCHFRTSPNLSATWVSLET